MKEEDNELTSHLVNLKRRPGEVIMVMKQTLVDNTKEMPLPCMTSCIERNHIKYKGSQDKTTRLAWLPRHIFAILDGLLVFLVPMMIV